MQNNKQNYSTLDYLAGRALYGWFRFKVWFKKNLRSICLTGLFALPIMVMFLGDGAASDGTQLYFGIVNWVFIGVEVLLAIGFGIASKVSSPQDVPVPSKRFTRHDGDQTWIDDGRVQELVLYMEKLEDWFYDNYYSDER